MGCIIVPTCVTVRELVTQIASFMLGREGGFQGVQSAPTLDSAWQFLRECRDLLSDEAKGTISNTWNSCGAGELHWICLEIWRSNSERVNEDLVCRLVHPVGIMDVLRRRSWYFLHSYKWICWPDGKWRNCPPEKILLVSMWWAVTNNEFCH